LGRVEWAPDVPSIRQRRAQSKFFAAYRAARHEFYEEVAALTGLRMLIVDSPDLANVVGTDVILPPAKH
jgi:hypothetical protein